ncbi:hypothetical protein [Microbacterium sp. SD291]|uniref:hypothetical protein n=1 Tax=Microbacterium sp. SD291 TaxID=2782007 RepID=UPI001A97388E|nr:hypothetical protein [Microbacterium sp. SD291]MBO0981501.1 hypothetical protein [Microbacterium sp. SD291]
MCTTISSDRSDGSAGADSGRGSAGGASTRVKMETAAASAFRGAPKGIAMLTATASAVAYVITPNVAFDERFAPITRTMTRLSLDWTNLQQRAGVHTPAWRFPRTPAMTFPPSFDGPASLMVVCDYAANRTTPR